MADIKPLKTESGRTQQFASGDTVPIANGGTGQTSASAAINALVPTQSGNALKFLQTTGSAVQWASPPATDGGGTGQIPIILSGGTSDVIDITAAAALTDLSVVNTFTFGKTTDIFIGDSNVGWKDLTTQIQLRGRTSDDPEWVQVGGGTSPFWGYKFATGKRVWMFFHPNHDYKPGGAMHLHVHWMSAGTNTTNRVRWEFQYGIAKGHNQDDATRGDFPIASPATIGVEEVSGGQYRHMVSETVSLTTHMDRAEVDSLIWVQMSRVVPLVGSDNADDIILLTVDLHYQMGRFSTPNRAPDFYA